MSKEKIQSRERNCGNCTACCFTHPVAEINKTAFSNCENCEAGKGCKIYENRPQGCRSFACQWKLGNFHQIKRPDKSGVVVDFVDLKMDNNFFPVVYLFEYKLHSFNTKFFLQLVKTYKTFGFSVVTIPISGKASFLCKAEVLQEGQEVILPDGRKVDVINF